MRIDALPLTVTDSEVMHLALQVMLICLKLSAPILLTALVIGFAISLFQSMTQIQEFTLAFVPKVIGIGLVLLFCGNWMLHSLVSFTQHLFEQVPSLLD
jgi:flagellar biosynthetic protein FliQ